MRRNWLEWVILVASVVVTIAVVGFLVIQALGPVTPAQIIAEGRPDEAHAAPAGWILPVTVRNAGSEAAASIVIEATATVGGEEETSEVTVELLPALSEAEAAVGFSAEPEGSVEFRVVGYESP